MPADTYNGMVLTVTKNLAKGVTIHVVAFRARRGWSRWRPPASRRSRSAR